MTGIQGWECGRRWLSAAAIALGMLLLVMFLSQASAAAEPERIIRLQTADVTLRPGVYKSAGSRYAVLQLGRNLRRAEIDALAAEGVRLLSYLGDGVFIAGIDPAALTVDVTTTYDIEAAAPWLAENKAAPALRQGMAPDWARTDGGLLKLTVLFFADVAPSEMEEILGRHTGSYALESPPRLWAVEIEPSRLDALLHEQGIHVIEPGPIPFQPLLDDSRALIHVDEVQQASFTNNPPAIWYDGLTGRGVTLQVSESVWDGHPDFSSADGQTRFVNPSPDSGGNHGTHVAGIMGGDGVLSASLQNSPFYGDTGRWRGMAPEAALYDGHYDGSQGSLINASNHSYVMTYGTYSSYAAGVDGQIQGDAGRDLRWPKIWAAANQGWTSAYNDEEGYYSMYAPAKNSIAVGSVNANDAGLSEFSSLGPTFDGRIKPDVMAPGGKNLLPKAFDVSTDRIQVTIDYIRVYNARTGSLDNAWEFNHDGDAEGWFQGGSNYNIIDLTVSGGSMRFQAGLNPDGSGNKEAWGWNETVNIETDPDQVIVMKYKMSAPTGASVGESTFWFHPQGNENKHFGEARFRSVVNDTWIVKTIEVGRWGLSHDDHFGGWTGTIDKLGMVPFGYKTGIRSTFYDDVTQTYAYLASGFQGTSMAAPAVTGGVGLILQQFHDQLGVDLKANPPLPSTIKAILVQTADDMIHETADPRDPSNPDTGTPVLYYEGPDFASGYGLVNIKTAVDLVGADPGPGALSRFINEGEIDGDEVQVYEMQLTADDVSRLEGQLKFTLAWDDWPGDPTTLQTDPKLVNDLDLYLIAPDGTIHLPWTLDPLPVADCGGNGPGCGDLDPIEPYHVEPARKEADVRNNVELVQLDSAMPGDWLVVVEAYSVPLPMQTYSLVGNQPVQASDRQYAPVKEWVEMGTASASGGGISATRAGSWLPSLAISPEGMPIIAWKDDGWEIYVRRWNDTAWVEMSTGSASGGGISANSGQSTSPSLAISPNGMPVIAWEDWTGNYNPEIYVRRWNGTAWVEMGSNSASGGGISANDGYSYIPSLAIGPNGRAIVAWSDDSSGNDEVYVKRWNGTVWVEMDGSASGGGISDNTGGSLSPSLAISPDGTPVVAWMDDSGDVDAWQIYVRRWDGASWVEIGSGSASGEGISDTAGYYSLDPSLAISRDGTPIIAWGDYADDKDVIYVRRWDGSAWVEMGSGSASGGGISGGSGNGSSPSVAIGPGGTPVIAWDAGSSDSSEIYVRQWTGAAWEEMGSGSASGRGISSNGKYSFSPSLAVRPDGTSLIAWSDDASGFDEIYVRQRAAGPSSTYFPAQESAPGSGWRAGIQVQNSGPAEAKMTFTGYESDGKAIDCEGQSAPPGSSVTFLTDYSCPSGHAPFVASVIRADQPTAAISNLYNRGVGLAGGQYRGTPGGDASYELFFPLVKNDHKGRTTGFFIQNASDGTNDIAATFRVQGQYYTKEYNNIPPYTSILILPEDAAVPPGFGQVGSLTVMAPLPIAGTSLEFDKGVSIADNLQSSKGFTPSEKDDTLYCPLFRNAHANRLQTTGVQVQNVTEAAQRIDFSYVPVDGGQNITASELVKPGASVTFYAPALGIPAGSLGSVTVEGEGDIVAVVNDQGYDKGQRNMTTYSCFPANQATDQVSIPLYKEMYRGNTSGIQIQNVSGDGSGTTVTLTYRVRNSDVLVSFTHDNPIPDGASITFWGVSTLTVPQDIKLLSGNPVLLEKTVGSVEIVADQPIVAIANETSYGVDASGQDAKNYEGFNN